MNHGLHPIPPGLQASEFTVALRQPDGSWQSGSALRCDSMHVLPHALGGSEAAVLATASGAWSLRLELPEDLVSVEVLPSGRATAKVSGRVISIDADAPTYVVLNCNHSSQQPHRTLYLLIERPDDSPPQPGDPGVRWLEPGLHRPEELLPDQRRCIALRPGVHEIDGQLTHLAGDMRLHLCPGAFLRSYLRADGVSGLRITGSGVIDGTGVRCRGREWRDDGWDAFVFLRRCRDCSIDGPVIYDAPFWNLVTFGTVGTRIRRHKALTWKVNNDGVQPRSCQDLVVEDSFLKCADDCIAVKTRRDAGLHSHDLLFRRLTLWNDQPGNPLEIGHTSQARLLERVTFEDIAIVHAETGALLSIALIDGCEVRDVCYRRIRQEGYRNAAVLAWRIETSRYTTDPERGHLHGIRVEGLDLAAGPPLHGRIHGFDADHAITDVRLDGVRLDGQSVLALRDLHLDCVHVRDVNFSPAPNRS